MGLASDVLQKVTLGARELQSSLVQGVGDASEFVRKNPVTSAVGVAGGVLAGGAVIQIVRRAKSKIAKAKAKRKKTTKKKTSKGRSRDRKFISKQKSEQAYIRRKRKAGKPITRPRYKTKKSKTKGKAKRFVKGSPEAKRFMAKLRRMRK